MKKNKIVLICLLVISLCNKLNAQYVANDVFREDVFMTYLGIDFSNAKYFGEEEIFDAAEFAGKINKLIINEYDKYNVSKALKQPNLLINIQLTMALNQFIKEETFFTYNFSELNVMNEDTIQDIVKNYSFENNLKGIGFVFIVENLNKPKEEEVVWATFIDISTKKVLFTEKMKANADGIGLRNHWANPFAQIIGEIKKSKLKKWKTKYASKDK